MAPSMAIAVDVDNIPSQDTYKDLISKIKVRLVVIHEICLG